MPRLVLVCMSSTPSHAVLRILVNQRTKALLVKGLRVSVFFENLDTSRTSTHKAKEEAAKKAVLLVVHILKIPVRFKLSRI